MKDLEAEYSAPRDENVQLLGLLNLYLEREPRFQPREKGLSLIEATPEVSCPSPPTPKEKSLTMPVADA